MNDFDVRLKKTGRSGEPPENFIAIEYRIERIERTDMKGSTTTATTCGTSVLTNGASSEDKKFLNSNANKRQGEYSEEERERLLKIVETRRAELLEADEAKVRKMSAELNGFVACYLRDGGRLSDAAQDLHFLIHTDTWQGRLVAELLRDWGEARGIAMAPILIEDLNTANLDEFRLGIGNLIRWCAETLPGCRAAGSRVVFNLVGGFKSLQGYMQTLGMFYADETVYIFEGGDELLSIPRMPVDFEASAKRAVLDHFETFRKMQRGDLPLEQCAGIPETMLKIIDGRCTPSEWGEIVWGAVREERYKAELLPPLSPLLSFSEKMRSDASKLFKDDGARMFLLNQAMDRMSRYLDSGKKDNLSSCDYKKFTDKDMPGVTHEFDLWPDKRGWRAFCHEDGPRVVVDSIGEGKNHN